MGCAVSSEPYNKKNPKYNAGYWYDREENLVTVNYTDSDSDFDSSSVFQSDFESSVIETLPTALPMKANKLLLDSDRRKDSGIDIDCDGDFQFTFEADEDESHTQLILDSLLQASHHLTSAKSRSASRALSKKGDETVGKETQPHGDISVDRKCGSSADLAPSANQKPAETHSDDS